MSEEGNHRAYIYECWVRNRLIVSKIFVRYVAICNCLNYMNLDANELCCYIYVTLFSKQFIDLYILDMIVRVKLKY